MFQKFKITSCAFIVAFAVLVTLLVNGIAIGQEVDEQAIITSDPERTLKEEIEAIERQKAGERTTDNLQNTRGTFGHISCFIGIQEYGWAGSWSGWRKNIKGSQAQ